jgi:flagellar basal-body rod protein FlgG
MPKGIYAAASAMVLETRAQEVNARNLANQQTPGYREETLIRNSFAEALKGFGHQGNLASDGGTGVLPNGSYFNFSDGPMEPTSAPFDLALRGEGFFRVRDEQGKILLTRAGHFSVDNQAQLVTQEGWTVEGQGGVIVIPPNTDRVVVAADGTITADISEGGSTTQVVLDRLRIVTVPDKNQLIPVNGQYFTAGTQADTDVPTATVMQGQLEKANLEPLEQLVQMISVQRRYDAAQRALKEQANVGGSLSDLLRGGS